jgi:iron complex outermembrane receptor protein
LLAPRAIFETPLNSGKSLLVIKMKIQKQIALATASLCVGIVPVTAVGSEQPEIIEEVVVTSSYVRPTQLEKHSLIIESAAITNGPTRSLGESLDDYSGIASSDYGAAVGQPVIRGLSGDRVKILSNGMPVRDVSGIGADHLNEVDLSNVSQVEIAKGPASLLYASGTAGGIINIVDNAISRADLTESTVQIGAESQTVNDGYSGSLSYSGNISGLNVTYSFKDGSYGDFDIPKGAVQHSDEEHHDEEDHDEVHEEEHEDEQEEHTGSLANSDFATRSHKLGVSKVGDWGYIGVSYSDIESVFGVPFHGDENTATNTKMNTVTSMKASGSFRTPSRRPPI